MNKTKEEILSEVTGETVFELQRCHEVQIIRPSEVYEAMEAAENQSRQQGMEWVSLVEDLPHKEKEVYIKNYPRLYKGWVRKEFEKNQGCYFINIYDQYSRLTSYREGHEELKNIFWLDESAESLPAQPDRLKEAQWISIKDNGQPIPTGTDFLVLFHTGEIRRFTEEDLPVEIMTHWMPLPEPPSETNHNTETK